MLCYVLLNILLWVEHTYIHRVYTYITCNIGMLRAEGDRAAGNSCLKGSQVLRATQPPRATGDRSVVCSARAPPWEKPICIWTYIIQMGHVHMCVYMIITCNTRYVYYIYKYLGNENDVYILCEISQSANCVADYRHRWSAFKNKQSYDSIEPATTIWDGLMSFFSISASIILLILSAEESIPALSSALS